MRADHFAFCLFLLLAGFSSVLRGENQTDLIALEIGPERITLPNSPLTKEQQEIFDSLTPDLKKAFQEKREFYLKLIGKFMRLGYPAYRVGSPILEKAKPFGTFFMAPYHWIKDVISEYAKKSVGKELETVFKDLEQKERGLELDKPELSVPVEGRTKERYRRLIQNTLRHIDQELWNRSPLVAEANEYFVIFQLGGGGGAGVGDLKSCKGGFACAGINVGLSVNPKEKRLSAYYFNDIDSLKKVVGMFGGGNLFGSVEFGLGFHDVREKELKSETGTAVMPPGPFMGIFTPTSFQFGVGIGPTIAGINLPTPSLMTTEITRYHLIRASIAGKSPYFTLQLGAEPAKELLQATKNGAASVVKVIQKGCQYLFKKMDGVIL